MHESTVSRVTSNKYMATPLGNFELKYFFTSAISSSTDGEEAHSSESVRHRIRQLIEGETAKSILSDDKIVEKLKVDGIDIARRTVAKYREAMRIPSSVQRRREKKLADQMAGTNWFTHPEHIIDAKALGAYLIDIEKQLSKGSVLLYDVNSTVAVELTVTDRRFTLFFGKSFSTLCNCNIIATQRDGDAFFH